MYFLTVKPDLNLYEAIHNLYILHLVWLSTHLAAEVLTCLITGYCPKLVLLKTLPGVPCSAQYACIIYLSKIQNSWIQSTSDPKVLRWETTNVSIIISRMQQIQTEVDHETAPQSTVLRNITKVNSWVSLPLSEAKDYGSSVSIFCITVFLSYKDYFAKNKN